MKPRTTHTTESEELATFIPAGRNKLFGVLTTPWAESKKAAVVLLNAAAWIPAVGKNRLWVRVGRRLAASGYHTLRFDYHGVGESTGETDVYGLDPDFEDDVRAAIDWLREQGIESVVLVGWCFGARLGLMCAPRMPEVKGLVALSLLLVESEGVVLDDHTNPPILKRAFNRKTLRRLLHKQYRGIYWRVLRGHLRRLASKFANLIPFVNVTDRWSSKGFVRDMRALNAAGLPLVTVFGKDEPFYTYFQEARAGVLGKLLSQAGEKARVELLGNDMKRLVQLEDQELLVESLPGYVDWILGNSITTDKLKES